MSKLLGIHFLQCDGESVKIDRKQTIIEMLDKHDLLNLNGVDIAFAAHKITRRCHAQAVGDWKLDKRVARYMSGTRATFPDIKPDDRPTLLTRLVLYNDTDIGRCGGIKNQSAPASNLVME